MKHSISVVIPNYNGRSLLERYLPVTLEVCRRSRLVSEYEIIVADDHSTDDSLQYVKEHFPMVRTVESGTNDGFSCNANRGIRAARYEWLLLLNSDMELTETTIDVLLQHCTPDVFGVSCLVKNPTGSSIQGALNRLTIVRHKINYIDNFSPTDEGYTMFLCGGLAMMNREKTMELGGFDEVYSPFYYEDTDLSLRAWQRGWPCMFTVDTYGLHQHSATVKKNHVQEYVDYVTARNSKLFSYRFLPEKNLPYFWMNIWIHAIQERLRRKKRRPYTDAYRIIRGGG